jgi:ferredoxin
MADMINNLYPENVPGKYYMDEQCIDRNGCPQTAEQEAPCAQAMRKCPVEAIGDDGELVASPGDAQAPGIKAAAREMVTRRIELITRNHRP